MRIYFDVCMNIVINVVLFKMFYVYFFIFNMCKCVIFYNVYIKNFFKLRKN